MNKLISFMAFAVSYVSAFIGSTLSSGLTGYDAFMVSMPFFIISFITFFLTNHASKYVAKLKIGSKATAVSGFLMALMGILKVFE